MLFQLFAACSCDILILFMICLGGEIIIHSYDLSVDAYHLFWYQYNSNSKYMVWFLIRHTQKPYYFASFKSLNCSLETFTNVWLLFISNHCTSNFPKFKYLLRQQITFSDHTKGWRCIGYASKHEIGTWFAKKNSKIVMNENCFI